MKFDLRIPLGWLFSIYGVLLVAYGVLSDPLQYQRSLGLNVNLVWGLVILVFGAIMLYFGRRARRRSGQHHHPCTHREL